MKEAVIEFQSSDWLVRECPDCNWGEPEEDYFSFIGLSEGQIVAKGAYRRMDRLGKRIDKWVSEVTVAVHPKHQGRGLGTATLQFMMDHMREQGITHALAHNYGLIDGPAGGELLESCGFTPKKSVMYGSQYECDLSRIGNF